MTVDTDNGVPPRDPNPAPPDWSANAGEIEDDDAES